MGKSESVVATGGYVSPCADVPQLLVDPLLPSTQPLEISGVFVPSNRKRLKQTTSKSRTHDVQTTTSALNA